MSKNSYYFLNFTNTLCINSTILLLSVDSYLYLADGKMVENSAVEKDAVPDAALSNDDKACSNVG